MTPDTLNAIGMLLLTFFVLRLYGKNRTRIEGLKQRTRDLEYKVKEYEFKSALLRHELRKLNGAKKEKESE